MVFIRLCDTKFLFHYSLSNRYDTLCCQTNLFWYFFSLYPLTYWKKTGTKYCCVYFYLYIWLTWHQHTFLSYVQNYLFYNFLISFRDQEIINNFSFPLFTCNFLSIDCSSIRSFLTKFSCFLCIPRDFLIFFILSDNVWNISGASSMLHFFKIVFYI